MAKHVAGVVSCFNEPRKGTRDTFAALLRSWLVKIYNPISRSSRDSRAVGSGVGGRG